MNAPAPRTHMQWDDVIAFRTVAATLNLTAAAQHLGFSRAVISRRLQRLERTVGAVLLRRSTHGVTLTDAGHRLLRNVDAIGDLWEEAVADLADSATRTDGCNARPPLRLAAHTATVRLLSALAASSPDLTWQTEPFDETKSLDTLASGDLDVVVW